MLDRHPPPVVLGGIKYIFTYGKMYKSLVTAKYILFTPIQNFPIL